MEKQLEADAARSKIPARSEQKSSRPASGRKPAYESRATEFRQRLSVWRQTPESMRPTLRALARELGTSHQLLKHYLDGMEIWRAKEQAKQIRARAQAENRKMTLPECIDAILTPTFLRQIENLRREAKRGPLKSDQIKMLKLLAKQGFSGAKEILGKYGSRSREQCKKLELSPKQQLVLKSLPPAARGRYLRWLREE